MKRQLRCETAPAPENSGTSSPVALEVSQLHFAYPEGSQVLAGMNLQVNTGERLGLIGPNGAGKTTLFLLACAILTPDAGTVRVFGNPVRTIDCAPDINMVFQNPDDQLFCSSVWQDVAFGPQNIGLPSQEVTVRVAEALRRTGTQELADRVPHHLSGGEKRMVSIASILALYPRVVIYDEPSASLDMRARRRLIRFLRESRQSLLLASHDLEFVLEVCDRVVVVNEGQAIGGGDPATLMRETDLMEANGLETPHSLSSV